MEKNPGQTLQTGKKKKKKIASECDPGNQALHFLRNVSIQQSQIGDINVF